MTVTVRDQVEQEFECPHSTIEMRRRIVANGVTHVYRQCVECGKSFGAVGSKDLLPGLVATMALFDEELLDNQRTRRSARWQELATQTREEKSAAWWRAYNAYLLTPQWREKRALVLARDKHICQACRQAPATQVHHTTYQHLFAEPCFELYAVCAACHERLHGRSPFDEEIAVVLAGRGEGGA